MKSTGTPDHDAAQAIKATLSTPRIETYEAATPDDPTLSSALALYAWNAQVSAALLAPLHICEVSIRNAISEAIVAAHGPQWPWSAGFVRSLPNPLVGYSARSDLLSSRVNKTTTGQVIADLKFVFWQTMFTSRFDARLWTHHLRQALPYADAKKTTAQTRALVYSELEQIRKLRNRIAHHEPIFQRNLATDFQKIHDLIAARCPITAAWMLQNQGAQALILNKPA
ncbi:hypothetical protein [Limnohabitans lacus]|uniref:Abi-like protein n=1 Tax=Limnohabitans lacus TaxID=3045173 RepID=A0ABT6X450_9BURK|nr:hypothetical protein [Limnohabitans sp. HM2-2]MDI9232898.1 hypothetical protein [Limnohabitans sp. HM2-2]